MLNFAKNTIKRFSKIVKKFLPQKRHALITSVALVVFSGVGVLACVTPAHAQLADIAAGFVNGVIYVVSWILLVLAEMCIGLTIFALKFFIWIAAYNGFIDAPAVKVGWVMVRDVANLFFVVILLVIAFATILGLESYAWKKTLVKLLIAAVLINFSNMIAQLVIDFAHVFTMTFVNAIAATAGGNLINMFSLDKIFDMSGQELNWDNIGQDIRFDIFAAALVAFLFALVALVAIFFYAILMAIRMIVLWVLIILSPIAYITSIIPATKKYADEYWQEFTKNVLVAPLLVFFLWLAFATMGAGSNINDHMNKYSSQSEQLAGGQQTTQAVEGKFAVEKVKGALSINAITRWENIASYLIALVFLFIGLDQVSKTGAKGAGMVSGVTDFGKKVATIASGYAVGRWAVGKGREGVKLGALEIGKRVPLVGGAAWKERWAGVKSKVSRFAYEGREKRAQQVKGWEKEAREAKGWRGFRKKVKAKVLGAVWEPTERKLKRAKDWTDAAEAAKEKMMLNLSTSKSEAGKAKLEQTVRLQFQKGVSEAKGVEKIEHFVNQVIGFDKQLEERVSVAMSDPAKQAEIADEIATQEQEKITKLQASDKYQNANKVDQQKMEALERKKVKDSVTEKAKLQLKEKESQPLKEEFIKNLEGVYGKSYAKKVAKRADSILSDRRGALDVKARTENMKEVFEEETIKETAKSRAANFRAQGQDLKAEAVEKAAVVELNKKRQELFTNLNYVESLATGADLSQKLQTAITQGIGDASKLTQQTMALVTSAMAKDSETGMDTLRSMLGQTGWDEEINDKNRLRAFLTAVTQKMVTDGNEQTAIEGLKENYDSDREYNEAMRTLSGAFKKTAIDGGTVMAGLVGEGMKVQTKTDKDGNTIEVRDVVYDFGKNVGNLNKKGKAHPAAYSASQDISLGNISYYAGRVSNRSVTSVADMGSSNINGALTGFGDNERQALGKFFNGLNINAMANMQASFWDSWNDAVVTKENASNYVSALEELSKNLGEKEYEKFRELTKVFIGKVEQMGGNIPKSGKAQSPTPAPTTPPKPASPAPGAKA